MSFFQRSARSGRALGFGTSRISNTARMPSISMTCGGADSVVAPAASCFSSSRRLLTAASATSATASGCVRSATAASCRTRSCFLSSSTPIGPVTASIRRTFAADEVSWVILKTPISAVACTCVPPHSSRDQSPAPTSTIRTTSPYFSPNSAIAPSARASSSVVVSARTGWFSSTISLTRSSTQARSSSESGEPCVKSKRSLSGPT